MHTDFHGLIGVRIELHIERGENKLSSLLKLSQISFFNTIDHEILLFWNVVMKKEMKNLHICPEMTAPFFTRLMSREIQTPQFLFGLVLTVRTVLN